MLQTELGIGLSGVYVHGSAAVGGWNQASDLDMLVTSNAAELDWPSVGRHLLSMLAPTPAVELSVVADAAAATPTPPWPFLMHLNHREGRVVADEGSGDPDLAMHYVVTRHSGITLTGRTAGTAIGCVPRAAVLAYLSRELTWALTEADERYLVLNTCRALAYCRDGAVLSKIDGGRWALANDYDPALINGALDAQSAGRNLGTPTPAARSLVDQCQARLTASADATGS